MQWGGEGCLDYMSILLHYISEHECYPMLTTSLEIRSAPNIDNCSKLLTYFGPLRNFPQILSLTRGLTKF